MRGRIYRVREVFYDDGLPGALLVGIRGPLNAAGPECGFKLTRSRWLHT